MSMQPITQPTVKHHLISRSNAEENALECMGFRGVAGSNPAVPIQGSPSIVGVCADSAFSFCYTLAEFLSACGSGNASFSTAKLAF
jgi:hypothetical protein